MTPPLSNASDHPRVRGENIAAARSTCRCAGSPPRARGEHRRPRQDDHGRRITPACAGRTGSGTAPGRASWDHPRVRGENNPSMSEISESPGSPPRARGEPAQGRPGNYLSGITPACAGRTSPFGNPAPSGRDHPRVRGENIGQPSCCNVLVGSPPRARGERGVAAAGNVAGRITPACAGRTSRSVAQASGSRDHPRVRGENVAGFDERNLFTGSPPRARGEHGQLPVRDGP